MDRIQGERGIACRLIIIEDGVSQELLRAYIDKIQWGEHEIEYRGLCQLRPKRNLWCRYIPTADLKGHLIVSFHPGSSHDLDEWKDVLRDHLYEGGLVLWQEDICPRKEASPPEWNEDVFLEIFNRMKEDFHFMGAYPGPIATTHYREKHVKKGEMVGTFLLKQIP